MRKPTRVERPKKVKADKSHHQKQLVKILNTFYS